MVNHHFFDEGFCSKVTFRYWFLNHLDEQKMGRRWGRTLIEQGRGPNVCRTPLLVSPLGHGNYIVIPIVLVFFDEEV